MTAQPVESNYSHKTLLGGLIFDPGAMDEVLEAIPRLALDDKSAPLFQSPWDQQIWDAAVALSQRSEPVTIPMLIRELKASGKLEQAGGIKYVSTLSEVTYSPESLKGLAHEIVEEWRCRKLAGIAEGMKAEATPGNSTRAQERAETRMMELRQERESAKFRSLGQIIPEVVGEIEACARGGANARGLMTGYHALDRMTAGFRPSQMIIIAARPSMGKTAFVVNIGVRVATNGKPVGIFSLEMDDAELAQRIVCTQSRIPMHNVRGHNPISNSDLDLIKIRSESLKSIPLYIDQTGGLTPPELRAKARALKRQRPDLALLIIDYLQLMNAKGTNRQEEVSVISRSIKALARELSIPIIALSQLSRDAEKRKGTKDEMPRLSDLRESGSLEQDADIVMFIHRKSLKTEPGVLSTATIRIGKHRNGQVGDFELGFIGEFTEFVNMAR